MNTEEFCKYLADNIEQMIQIQLGEAKRVLPEMHELNFDPREAEVSFGVTYKSEDGKPFRISLAIGPVDDDQELKEEEEDDNG